MSFEKHEAKDYGHDLELAIINTKSVFHKLQEVGVKLKALIYHMLTFYPKSTQNLYPRLRNTIIH